MSQLLQSKINTTFYTNTILRNYKDLPQVISLRENGINLPDFKKLSIFKDLILDLTRLVNSEYIIDVSIINLKPGNSININEFDNRLILNLENTSTYNNESSRYIPAPGDLIWTNEKLDITNTSNNLSIFLIIDFKEFIL